jgi:hypothetical protein
MVEYRRILSTEASCGEREGCHESEIDILTSDAQASLLWWTTKAICQG